MPFRFRVHSVAMAVAVLSLVCPAASAQSVLPHLGNECASVPQCVAVGGAQTVVPADQSATIVVVCPANRPNGWHWDTEQLSHLSVRLVGRSRDALTFSVTNHGSTPGWASIMVGCSTAPFDVTKSGAQTSRTGIPLSVSNPSRSGR